MRAALKNYTFVDYATQVYILIVAVLILLFHNETVKAWPWLLLMQGALLASVHTLIVTNARRSWVALDFLRHLYPVLLYVLFFAETGWLNRMFFTEFQDPMIIRWEQALFGGQPGITFMQRLPWLWVSEPLYASYFSYYIMISGIGIALYVRNRSQFFHFVSVLSFVFYCCYTLYILLPVAGPRVFLNAFVPVYTLPEQLHALAPVAFYPEAVTKGPFYVIMGVIYDVFESPGAAFPSSHVAAALCTLYFSFRYLPRVFPFHTVAVLLLCLSTIYGRYHYAVDVLAGILTALVLIPVGNNLYARFSGKRGDLTNGTASKLPLRAQP